MKTLYTLAIVCMSLHAWTASADTPALMADDDSIYVISTDDRDIGDERSAQGTTPEAQVATAPASSNVIDPDADDYAAADIIPGITPVPQSDDETTGSVAESWTGETE